ncbi:peptidyl-prolyl cis-trans isomerase [Amylibacter ulvae]|uniref:Peptidyl-prolyl cis-trans isomerase n=1 Tax=Paramylibacter ulvae TaxID=1651968 RepID=A0ABQ3CRT6_9RHOB|nr:peptidylprolyl isomerase [Amylibacter ulvae]GHA41077.1 peptidyl-prolyl cis-trans isomerase [Amylibacter ulvae]
MLSAMRSGKNRYFFYALLGLLALGLIGFGSGNIGGGSARSIGKVGEQSVSINTYANTLNNAVQTMAQRFGRTLSPAEIEGLGLQRNVLSAVLSSAALDNEAKRLGISVGDTAVATTIRQTPSYQGLDGSFDKEAYEFALERSNVSAGENETAIREGLARAMLERAVTSGLTGAQTQAMNLISFANETRDFDWIEIDETNLVQPIPAPTDEQLNAFYTENPDRYTTPVAREITYAWLSPTMVEDQVEIPADELRNAYDLQTERYNRPERRAIDRLVFADNDAAIDARNRLDSGSITFDALITERGLEPGDVDLGELTKDDVSTGAADGLFDQDELGVFGPFDSDLGPAIYRINAILQAEITSFEDAEEELHAEMVGDSAARLVSGLLSDIDERLAAGATLEELTTETQMELGQISFTSESEDSIAAYDEFRDAAEQANVDDFPEVLELSDGGFFALRLNEIKDPTLRPLADVKDMVITDWIAAETAKALQTRGEAIIAEIASGKSIADFDVVVETKTGANRGARDEQLPITLISDLFELDLNAATLAATDDTVVIAQLKNITAVDGETGETAILLDTVNTELRSQVSADILDLFSQALQQDAGVTLNQVVINSVDSQIISGQ